MKRAIKIFLICVAVFFILIVIAIASLRIYFNDSRIKTLISDSIVENTGGEVAIGHLDIYDFIKIKLEDLEIRNEENDSVWLKIAGIDIDIKPLSLLAGDIHVSNMIIGDVNINYAHLPEFKADSAGGAETSEPISFPVDFVIDRFEFNNLVISGPDAELGFDFLISALSFSGRDKFTAAYSIKTNKGIIHYSKSGFSIAGDCDIVAAGEISSLKNGEQNLKASLSSIKIMAGKSLYVDDITLTLSTVSKLQDGLVEIEDLSFNLNNETILGLTGHIDLKDGPELSLRAGTKSWDISGVNALLGDFDIPVILSGIFSLEDLSILVSPTYFSYDFTSDLKGVGIDYDNTIFLRGLSGAIYSSGDPQTVAFGSSLIADSISVVNEGGQMFGIYKLSSSVETEFSSNDVYFNINAGVADFFGGKFDIFAFTESSNIEGDLRIENFNISKATSGLPLGENFDFSGLVDMVLEISGQIDSVQSNLSGSLANLKIMMEDDSLYIPRQDFNLSASTIIGKESVDSRFAYDVHKNISGVGEFHFPVKTTPKDSIIVSYKVNLDNSVLPSYLPSALIDALGAVELSGGSVLDGRFSSPSDTVLFTGSSKLTIEPTDILISDFQSVLYSLISVSELEVTSRGISLFSNSGIEDLFNENYSDLDFSGITVEGEIVSLSDTTWRVTNMNVALPSLKSRLDIMGDFGYAAGVPFSNLTLYFTFNSDEAVEIWDQLYLSGVLKAEIRTATIDTLLEFSGAADLRDMEVESQEFFKCGDINGEFPFSGKINLQDSMFVVTGVKRELSGSGYQRARLANMPTGEFGRLRIGYIAADPFYILNVNMDAGFSKGVFEIPYLTGELLGGNFYGMLKADLSDLNMMREIPNYKDLRYKLDLELSKFDFNRLTNGMGPFEDRADFAADAHFLGNGIIAPGEEYSISGSFHITEMGPGVALRVLEVLDPENSNPSIMQTKGLLDRKLLGLIDISYKPKNFSFELKHGSLYPRLFMDQPFFADVLPLIRVPMPVEYGRIPVRTLLANLKEKSW